VLAWALACFACRAEGAKEQAAASIERTTPLVEVVAAREGELPLTAQVTGTLRARNQVAIHPEIEARIVEVLVRDGDQVARGQPLVRLEPVSMTSQLRQAQANVELSRAAAAAARARLAELEAELVRTRKLAEKEIVSPLELETLEARYAAAQAAAQEAEASITEARASVANRRNAVQKTVVRAPVDGRVGQRNAEIGMLADPNTVLFVVGDVTNLVVEVALGEKVLAHVAEGQTVHVRSPALGSAHIEASLSRVSPFVEPGSFSTAAEIDLESPDPRLRPGMLVTVDILYGESRRATLVPLSVLWEEPTSGDLVVYVTGPPAREVAAAHTDDTRRVEARAVELVAHGHDTAGISGVRPGEWVVTVGQFLLAEDNATTARVRVTSWDAVLELQTRQQEDLLLDFLEKQQRLARTRGARPPTVDELANGTSTDDVGATAAP
jgi:RND family efflux transporter MFP subunit